MRGGKIYLYAKKENRCKMILKFSKKRRILVNSYLNWQFLVTFAVYSYCSWKRLVYRLYFAAVAALLLNSVMKNLRMVNWLRFLIEVTAYGIVSYGNISNVVHGLTVFSLLDSVGTHVVRNFEADSGLVVLGMYLFCFE